MKSLTRLLRLINALRRPIVHEPNYVVAGVVFHDIPKGGFVIPQPDDGSTAFVAEEDIAEGDFVEVNPTTGYARKAR